MPCLSESIARASCSSSGATAPPDASAAPRAASAARACGTEPSRPRSAASAAPRASPPARSAARGAYSAPSGLRAARRRQPRRRRHRAADVAVAPAHARGSAGTRRAPPRGARRNFATLWRRAADARPRTAPRGCAGWRAAAATAGVAAEGERVLKAAWAASGCNRGARRQAGVQRGAAWPPLARARERRRRRLGAGRRRSLAVGDARPQAPPPPPPPPPPRLPPPPRRPPQRRRRRRRRRGAARPLRRPPRLRADRSRGRRRRRHRRRRQRRRPRRAACSRANDSTSAAPASASARRGGGCGGAAAATAWASRGTRGERLGAAAHGGQRARRLVVAAGWHEGGSVRAARAPRVCIVLECRHSLEQRTRAHARAGRRRVVAAARRSVSVGQQAAATRPIVGTRARCASFGPSSRGAMAPAPSAARCRPARGAVAAGGGASRNRGNSDARAWRSRRQPAASSVAVARCSSYRSSPHTSALCSAHVSCHARLGAPGSDRSWRSAPRACLACSSASAHRPRADAAAQQCARSACASRRPRFDVGGGSRSSETRSEVCGSATSDVERRESPQSSRSAASPTRCTSEGEAPARACRRSCASLDDDISPVATGGAARDDSPARRSRPAAAPRCVRQLNSTFISATPPSRSRRGPSSPSASRGSSRCGRARRSAGRRRRRPSARRPASSCSRRCWGRATRR